MPREGERDVGACMHVREFVLGTPGYRGISIEVCRKEGAGGGLHTPWVNDLK